MLEYKEYKEKLKEMVQENLGDNIEVDFVTTEKNNGSLKEGITLYEKGINFIPCIYLDELYQKYTVNEDIQTSVKQVLEIFETKKHVNADEVLGVWDAVKDKVSVRVVHSKWNQKRLEGMPYKRFLNLSVIFHLVLQEAESGNTTLLIHNQTMEHWGITLDILWKAAMKNLKAEDFTIQDLTKVVSDMLGTERKEDDSIGGMYIMTNKSRCYGASALLRTDLLAGFAERMKKDFYIIPSSVHEIMLMPDDEIFGVEYLEKMLREINKTMVKEEDVLSDQVYYFSRERGEVEEKAKTEHGKKSQESGIKN